MTLQATIDSIASKFAQDIVAVIRSASIEELLGNEPAAARRSNSKGGRLPRRSAQDVLKVVDQICSLLAKSDGLRAEALREKLGIEAKELPRPIALALKVKRITKSGNKRATTYKLAGGTKKAPKKKTTPKKKTKPAKAAKAANGAATP